MSPPPPPLQVLSDELVTQVIEHGETASFRKQLIALPSGTHVVRKTRAAGAEGPPVLLVHGFAQNRYTWHLSGRSMVNWLAVRGWDVLNVELRGHGRSRPQDMRQGECFADYVDDLVELIEALDEPPFLVGHSLGGAACYAASTRTRVRGVVGIGAIFHFGQHNWLLKALGTLTHSLRSTILARETTVRTRMFGRLMSKLYAVSDVAGYTFPISGWWPGSVEPALLEERLVKGFDWTSVRIWLDMSEWAATGTWEPWESDWATTKTPVLVLVGDEDHLAPLGDARVAFDRSPCEDRTLVLFDHYHHEVHWGHLDLILGRQASRTVWPVVEQWMADRRASRPQDPVRDS